MRFRLLGPFAVEADHGPVELRRRRERCLLAILLLHNNTPLPADRLAYLLWDGEPGPTSRQQVHTHVSRVRTVLRGSAVELRSTGTSYSIHADEDTIDACQFTRMVTAARRLGTPAQRATRLRAALDLWRGPALENTVSEWLRTRLVGDLDELRLAVTEEWLECRIAADDAGAVIPDLARLAAQHPDRERLVDLSMRALHLTGRTGEALETYQRHRARLADEQGLDPGERLRATQRAILRGDLTAQVGVPAAPPAVVPAQLPAQVRGFAGRLAELRELDALYATSDQPTTVVISALSGTAGVGKTALAVHWAHQMVDRFPDGQLYVDLRGFAPDRQSVAPERALRGFLDALHVPADRVPSDVDAQAALFRSLVAGKQMLVVLDNARDTEHVRPLLPGSLGTTVLVTSRNRLTSFVAAQGAHPIALDLMTDAEAYDLLEHRLGKARVEAEPDAVARLIAHCARLPLALAIVAARATTDRRVTLDALDRELDEAHHRLDPFCDGEPATDVRAVFSCSYRALTDPAARLFRLLGQHPGADTSVPAAASLAGTSLEAAREHLAELVDAHLLDERAPGRYAFHDLLRAYATELGASANHEQERQAAVRRLLDHYLHSAHRADRILYPYRDPIILEPAVAGSAPASLHHRPEAVAWLDDEYQAVPAMVRLAYDNGHDTHAWQLAWTLATFVDERARWAEYAPTQQVALDAARRLADQSVIARAHRALGRTYTQLHDFAAAQEHLQAALDLATIAGDHLAQANAHLNLGWIHDTQDNIERSMRHDEAALALFREAGHRHGEAKTLNSLGWDHARLENFESALACCEQAQALLAEMGERRTEATTWDSLGYIRHRLGQQDKAAACYERAAQLCGQLGDTAYQAQVLDHLGDAHHAAGAYPAARSAWQQALRLLTDIEDPQADQVRAKLA